MNTNEYKMLIELLKEASEVLAEFEQFSGDICQSYRYALPDELLGYALMLQESLDNSSPPSVEK